MLNQIKPQTPLLVLPSVISLRFQLATTLLPEPQKTLISHEVLKASQSKRPSISSRHGLWFKLRPYLDVVGLVRS